MSDVVTKVGATFEIAIDTVPTSGYTWNVAGLDEERLRLVGDELDVTSERVGAGAVQRFAFTALKVGEAEVRFALSRPWEAQPAQERTYGVTIRG